MQGIGPAGAPGCLPGGVRVPLQSAHVGVARPVVLPAFATSGGHRSGDLRRHRAASRESRGNGLVELSRYPI